MNVVLKRSLGTHSGSFHADEVTATALLIIFDLVDLSKLVRTRDLDRLDMCEFVCDVGGVYDPNLKRFDHHQSSYTGEMASAGMVLKYLHDEGVMDEALFAALNNGLILGVDAHDNGRVTPELGHCSFSGVVHNFVPISYDATPEDYDRAFAHALDFVMGHLDRMIARHQYIEACRDDVAKAMDEASNCLMFDQAMPWMDVFFALGGERHSAEYLIMPTGDHWKLRGIPPSLEDRMNVRNPLPENWAGLMGDELATASGISGAVFCHKGRFISVWKTKEEALEALAIATGEK